MTFCTANRPSRLFRENIAALTKSEPIIVPPAASRCFHQGTNLTADTVGRVLSHQFREASGFCRIIAAKRLKPRYYAPTATRTLGIYSATIRNFAKHNIRLILWLWIFGKKLFDFSVGRFAQQLAAVSHVRNNNKF